MDVMLLTVFLAIKQLSDFLWWGFSVDPTHWNTKRSLVQVIFLISLYQSLWKVERQCVALRSEARCIKGRPFAEEGFQGSSKCFSF